MQPPRLRLWPSLSPAVYARPRLTQLPFPLEHPSCRLYARGRHALWAGVNALGLRPGDEVLAPAYHCGTEIEALCAAGLRCHLYEATDTLEPEPDELGSLVGPRTRALLIIHYLGFGQDAARWRAWCDERALLLLEDCAHAAFASRDGRPVGSSGDLAMFSFHKTIPVPDVAPLLATSEAPAPSASRSDVMAVAKRHLRWAMGRTGALDRAFERRPPPPADDFALGRPRGAPRLARLLLPRVAGPEVAQRRRENYRRLLEAAAGHVPVPFRALPDGACPLLFPLSISSGAVLEHFDRAGIDAKPLWPARHRLFSGSAFTGAEAWHHRFVALPVHQELRTQDVDRLVAALQAAVR